MEFIKPYIYFLTTNFLFLLIVLICSIVRMSQVLTMKNTTAKLYYPASRWVTLMIGIQLLQFPYLLNVFSEYTFQYVLIFDLLMFIPFALLSWEKYFYRLTPKPEKILFIL